MYPLGNDTFTVLRAPLVTDPRTGSQKRDWANAQQIVVTNAKVNPFQLAEKLNFEINAEREYARTGLKFFYPPQHQILHTDRIEYNGQLFDVFGHPQIWTDFEGRPDHGELVAQLKEG